MTTMGMSVLSVKEELDLDFNHHSWSKSTDDRPDLWMAACGTHLVIETLRSMDPESSDEELQKQVAEWDGRYSSCGMFQSVTDEDARNLSTALSKALDDDLRRAGFKGEEV